MGANVTVGRLLHCYAVLGHWDTHLHDVDQYPVTHEPGQHVHHVEADRVHPEQSHRYPHHRHHMMI